MFLAGLSKGGFAVCQYGFIEQAKNIYCGYCIIAAGPLRGTDFSVAKGLPVLVLNGEKDPNLNGAKICTPELQKEGAITTQVIVPGQGHVPSVASMAPYLREWLLANGPLKYAQKEKTDAESTRILHYER